MAAKFSNMLTNTNLKIQETQQIPASINTQKITPMVIIDKLLKIIGKEKILKEAREKRNISCYSSNGGNKTKNKMFKVPFQSTIQRSFYLSKFWSEKYPQKTGSHIKLGLCDSPFKDHSLVLSENLKYLGINLRTMTTKFNSTTLKITKHYGDK